MSRRRPTSRRLAFALAAVALVAGCTGTVTPTLPTLLVVAREGAAPGLALVAVDLSPTGRALRLVTPTAHAFDAGTALLDLDALPRSGVPTEAWLLVADAAGATGLERFDLRDVPDDPAATVPRVASVDLTNADGTWAAALDTATAYLGPVCPRQIVVGGGSTAPNRYVAVWDRCGDAPSDPGRAHVVDLASGRVTSWSVAAAFDLDDVGLRAGPTDPATFTAVRDAIGEVRTAEARRFDLPSANPSVTAALTADAGDDLLDLAVAGGTWWALVRPDGGDVVVRGASSDGTESTRPALANATRLLASAAPGVLTLTGSQVQMVFPDTASPATALAVAGIGEAPAALAGTVEGNDYAVVATTGGTLCALDARVPAPSAGCEFTLAGMSGARFLTWTYAAATGP